MCIATAHHPQIRRSYKILFIKPAIEVEGTSPPNLPDLVVECHYRDAALRELDVIGGKEEWWDRDPTPERTIYELLGGRPEAPRRRRDRPTIYPFNGIA